MNTNHSYSWNALFLFFKESDSLSVGLMDLSDELLISVMKLLPLRTVVRSLSRVCKRMNWVSHDPSLWRRFSLTDTGVVNYTTTSF